MKRKLGFAKDEQGNSIAIESLDKKQLGKYTCPNCNKEVIPKMGTEVVWHFAHKGEDCPLTAELGKLDAEETQATSLDQFSQKTVPFSEMDIQFDPHIITCQICKMSINKLLSVDIGKGKHICKDCFKGFDRDAFEKLQG